MLILRKTLPWMDGIFDKNQYKISINRKIFNQNLNIHTKFHALNLIFAFDFIHIHWTWTTTNKYYLTQFLIRLFMNWAVLKGKKIKIIIINENVCQNKKNKYYRCSLCLHKKKINILLPFFKRISKRIKVTTTYKPKNNNKKRPTRKKLVY